MTRVRSVDLALGALKPIFDSGLAMTRGSGAILGICDGRPLPEMPMSRLSRFAALAALVLNAVVVAAQRPGSFTPLSLLPADASVSEFAVTGDGNRVYYSTAKGEVMLYDRKASKTTRISDGGDIWDITVARDGSQIAFTKNGENKDEYIWTIPLDATTGLPTGPQRRASMMPGDTPALSHNGRMLAFARDDSAGQSLVVLPALGGPERVLASFPVGIGQINWTPDSKSLYFKIGAGDASDGGTMRRISVNGGTSKVLSSAAAGAPGLSNDGSNLVFLDTGVTRGFSVTDTNGHRVATIVPPPLFEPVGWIGNSTLLFSHARSVWRQHVFDLATRTDRVLTDTMERTVWPSWSLNGKQVAFARFLGAQATQLIVMTPNGASGRAIPLRQRLGHGSLWSPDGRWILYFSGGLPSTAVAVEVATGKQVPLATSDRDIHARWMSDSRHVLMVIHAPGAAERSLSLREVDLAGTSRTLLEIPGKPGFNIFPVDDSSAIVRRGADRPTMLESISGKRPAVQLLPPLPGFFAVPMLSPDHQWAAFRRNAQSDDNTKLTVIDVVKMDGTARTTITPSFVVAAGTTVEFLPGEKQLMVVESPQTAKQPGVYMATIATGEMKRLFSINRTGNRYIQVSLSPDRKSILYTNADSMPAAYSTFDVSSFLKPNP